MADPLSITASAAGLVSLGIQVLGGITKYLDAVRERKDDVASAEQQVIRTKELLKAVAKVTVKMEPTHNTAAAFLRDSFSIQTELIALDELVRNLSTTSIPLQNPGILGKVCTRAKKLTYPFHRATIDRLQSRLARVNWMIQAALQVSMLDLAVDIEGNISAIKTTLTDSTLSRQITGQLRQEDLASRDAVSRVGDSVASLSSRLDESLAKGLEYITISTNKSLSASHQAHAYNQIRLLQGLSMTHSTVSGLSDTVKAVDTGIAQIQEDIATTRTQLASDYAENQAQMFQELGMTSSGISGLSEHLKRVDLALRALPTREELGRLLSKPGDLKDLCEVVKNSTELGPSQKHNHRSTIDSFRMTCVCRKRVVRSRQALLWGPWQASADTSTTHDHFTDCAPHYQGASSTSKRWAVAFKGLRGLINRALELSFTYSFGAGGCSLSPCFTYYPTVDRRRDPAFRIMSLFGWACTELEEGEPGLGEFLEKCIRSIGLLYRHGLASPKAVDQYGRSVLHYFAGLSTLSMDQDTVLRGLDTLLKHGVQANMYDTYGSTPAWTITCLMVRSWTWDSPDENLLDGVGHPSTWDSSALLSEFLCAQDPCETIVNQCLLEFSTSDETTMELFSMMQRSSATAEAFGCGSLSLAALEGNLQKIKSILANFPNAIHERNILNQTPLHLAVGHASCLALLVRGSGGSLINEPDSGGRRPIEYALFSCLWNTGASDDRYSDGCSKSHGDTSLNILLDEGCMIPKRTLWFGTFVFDFSLCKNCLLVLSQHLIGRRESLKMLAKSHLPEKLAVELGVSSPHLLDSNACKVIQNLDDRGIPVPLSLQMHAPDDICGESTSVYHSYGPLPFSVLWELGFRDIDRRDENGHTPLMSWCNPDLESLGRCSWLIERGANFRQCAPCVHLNIDHELYSKIGQLPPPLDDSDLDLRKHVFDLTRRISGQSQHPCSHCHCACSPPEGCTPFAQFLQAAFTSRYINSASEFMNDLPEVLMETHTYVSQAQALSAIRYATFEMLGIRHTGCHGGFGRTFTQHGCKEDAEELRQEDSFLETILDSLVAEFEKELLPQEMRQEQFDRESMSFWYNDWLPRVQYVVESLNRTVIDDTDKVAAEHIGVVWQKQEPRKGEDCEEDCDNTCEVRRYHETVWDSETDAGEMIEGFETMEDWTSRLGLIMSKAGLPFTKLHLQAYN